MNLRISKGGSELSLNTVIVAIIVTIVLIMVILILANYGGPLVDTLRERVNASIALSKGIEIKP